MLPRVIVQLSILTSTYDDEDTEIIYENITDEEPHSYKVMFGNWNTK